MLAEINETVEGIVIATIGLPVWLDSLDAWIRVCSRNRKVLLKQQERKASQQPSTSTGSASGAAPEVSFEAVPRADSMEVADEASSFVKQGPTVEASSSVGSRPNETAEASSAASADTILAVA